MREAGWSSVIPVERANQRNEEALLMWSEERWPQIKKKPMRTKRPSTGRDEARFYPAFDGCANLGATGTNAEARE
jgi:hypothetical protein